MFLRLLSNIISTEVEGINWVTGAYSEYLPSVCPHMSYKITFYWESLVTMAALVWSLSSVCSQMA